MSIMAWTNPVTLEFLELYRQEQHLWDNKHVSHRNRTEVTEGWMRIQAGLSIDCSVMDLKKKKESLMTSFRMHFTRKRKAAPGDYHTSWFAFEFMESFLGEKYDENSNNSSDDPEFYNTSSTSATYIEAPVVAHQYIPKNSTPKSHKKNKNQSSNGNEIKIDTVKSIKSDHFHYTKRPITNARTTDGVKKEMDECDLYGQLLVRKLRKLDEHQRDIAMHEIDNIMFQAKMNTDQNRTQATSSQSPVPRKVVSPLFIVTQDQNYEEENVYQQDPMESHVT